jgi:cytochrome c oxidase subunit 2
MRKIFFYAAMLWLAVVPAIAGAEGGAAPAKAAGVVINDPTHGWNVLGTHVLIDMLVFTVVFSIIAFYFIFKYTRKSDKQDGAMPKMSRGSSLAWAIIPTFLFLADDFYLAANGFKLWNDQRRVPEGALEVKLTGQMWGWEFDYGNGVKNDEDKEGRPVFIVPQGRPVVLRMSSNDVVHSFFMPDFRLKEDLMPGRVTYLWFYPKEVGEHVLTCTEFCGTGHSNMWGKVKVVPPAQFEAFLKAKSPAPSATASAPAPAEGQAPAQPAPPAGGKAS